MFYHPVLAIKHMLVK
ncbi:MAG: hypothetical protein LUH02_05315 [Erysipelotrichaceae bacterium]|nr:hypothetical protein [Erysipelotrichaceae bacterium]